MQVLDTVPKWAKRLAQIAVAAGLMALLWHAADGPEAARALAAAHWGWLGLAFLALSLQTVLSALRWRLTARQLGITLGAGHAIAEYYLAQIVNQSLPGGMVGDAGRAVRARGQAGLIASGQAVVFERLAGQIAMFAALALGFGATLLLPGGFDWPRWLAVPVALLLAGGAALPFVFYAATRLPGGAGRAAGRLWQALRVALASRRALPGQVGLSIGTAMCNLAAFAFCARAVGISLDPAAIAALVPLILFTMLIPISISGWGLREGAAAALLPLAGASASAALAASVAFGLVFIAAVLPGLVFLLRARPNQGADMRGAVQGES
ncbi:lysylphosphatidylglycerol synthase transmembrane domain-containing protein [Marivita sp. GX14005]|uniref:lysylphosphatidylglycerol synthase transmembrane domain-containing protein n=1 Tax=Marivita sp. GX14005 TaxID=2942276 RepID=UPI0020196E83|nr:lysylphosphatidylglycerol synthase transmembrane domain-containing protein [Marivita sp. GX14005]MCL3883238.1 flippase-like domain-containing protein [Marivita sp. GX14005]